VRDTHWEPAEYKTLKDYLVVLVLMQPDPMLEMQQRPVGICSDRRSYGRRRRHRFPSAVKAGE